MSQIVSRIIRALSISLDPTELLGLRVCSPASTSEVGHIVSVGPRDLCSVQWDHAEPGYGPARCRVPDLREVEETKATKARLIPTRREDGSVQWVTEAVS